VLVENVAALLGRGMGRVLGDLAENRYDAEWEVVSAADMGAPHLRERVWIMAYPSASDTSDRDIPKRPHITKNGTLRHLNEEEFNRGEALAVCEVMAHTQSERCREARNFDVSNPRNGLPAAAKMWPTPSATDVKGSVVGQKLLDE